MSSRRIPIATQAVHSTITRYRREAQKRGIAWELSDPQAKALLCQPCHYCGIAPSLAVKVDGQIAHHVGGIDRVDSAGPYSVANTVPCCWDCNRAKGVLSEGEFYAWVSRAFRHQLKRGVPCAPAQ